MAIRIISPKFSFVQFSENTFISDCVNPDRIEVLPVVEDNDIYFQFILESDTKDEADTLCEDSTGEIVTVGVANSCSDDNVLTFVDLPERYRIDDTHILYNWMNGLPGFQAVIDDGECFIIKISVDLVYGYTFCSGIFKRFLDGCFTAVIEYGNDDNFAGFNYCGGQAIAQVGEDCTPLTITFTNETNLTIPYTASLRAKYGNIPSVQVWIYDDDGNLVDMGIRVAFDSFPPTIIKADFGGLSSGIIKIS
jgi:hypothetical protein